MTWLGSGSVCEIRLYFIASTLTGEAPRGMNSWKRARTEASTKGSTLL